MVALITRNGSVLASQANPEQPSHAVAVVDGYQIAEVAILTGNSNNGFMVSSNVNVKEILRLKKIKIRKHKWRKARKLLKRHKRKFRKIRNKVRLHHSHSIQS